MLIFSHSKGLGYLESFGLLLEGKGLPRNEYLMCEKKNTQQSGEKVCLKQSPGACQVLIKPGTLPSLKCHSSAVLFSRYVGCTFVMLYTTMWMC